MAKLGLALCAICLVAAAASAQEDRAEAVERPAISIELNAAAQAEGGCTLSFLLSNGHDRAVESAVYEAVLFDAGGQVAQLTLFDFGSLPPGRPRVRQFTLPDRQCDEIGMLLINGAQSCEAPGLDAEICIETLRLDTRTDIEIAG
ncbi:hypothetical protein [Roseobacter sp. HKCCA0434]|uniref:hypothetical protein n=1 Tax=Roseobacter sp. HKCCA0434 TaxID=3079297 RepID=UPI002905EE4C|nr:hypothetical protein [Roseobacter sp. HKCCA0434]